MKVLLLVLVSLLISTVALATDHCNVYKSCQTCISEGDSLCGWCSQIDSEGFQCSGVNKEGRNNFTCNGIFSTESCEIGYACNNKTYTCDETAAGAGISKPACEAQCSPVGKLFKCNNETYKCEIVPTTSPGGQAQSICEAHCKNPASTTTATAPTHSHVTATHSPASMSPHSHSPQSSMAPVSTTATTVAPLYKCDPATVSCVPAKVGEAGSSSLSVCQSQCHHQNNTPSTLVGMWRAFPISNGDFSPSEYDYNFSASGDVQYTHTNGKILDGKATFVETSFVITFTDNSQQACLFLNQAAQPTTYEMVFACATGSTPPSSVSDAMAGTSSDFVLLASRCVDPTICQFTLDAGPNSKKRQQQLHQQRRHSSSSSSSSLLSSLNTPTINDKCMAFGANCSYCLAHDECGWCSNAVNYNISGTIVKGTQCAGFSSSGHSQWKCAGTYTSGQCLPGYACDPETQQCHLTTPGSGIPSLKDCTVGCKSKKGPPSQLVGNYRGIRISRDDKYPGVWRISMNSTHFTTNFPGGQSDSGELSHYAQYMFFTVGGQKTACVWSSNTATGGLVEYVTFACNIPGESLPAGFDTYMNPMNGTETILAKCLDSSCKW